ncbi:MAG: hypothetical protein ACOYOQ_00430 [Microthrixaceae bacterium]
MTADCYHFDCGCDASYGPCPDHCITVVQREGAALRTPIEVLVQYVKDAVDLGVELSPAGRHVLHSAEQAVGHLGDDPEVDMALTGLWMQVEADLETMDRPHYTYWDDGYRIVTVANTCPLSFA